MDPSWQPVTGAAQRRRGRRLRAAWRHEQQSIAQALAAYTHHSAPRRQTMTRAGGWERVARHGQVPEHPTPQAAGAQHFAMDAGEDVGEAPAAVRPAPLLEVLPQERVQRRTVELIVDCVPEVPLLDAPVPQTVDQLVEVLRPLDTVVPEQVIEVPKITFHDAILQRTVLPEPQMAEQLVDEPEELPRMVPRVIPGTRAWDAEGHEWSRVVGPAGVYWWRHGTSIAQWTPPEGLTASPGRYINTGQR